MAVQVLRAMARSKAPAVRRRFYQLRVMELLVREVSLEYEAAQQAALPPATGRPASATSTGTDYTRSPPRPTQSAQGGPRQAARTDIQTYLRNACLTACMY